MAKKERIVTCTAEGCGRTFNINGKYKAIRACCVMSITMEKEKIAKEKNKSEDKFIKIHITNTDPDSDGPGGESVWAIERGLGRAEIANLPFFSDVGYKDLVRYKRINGVNEYVETIVAKTISVGITWEPTNKSNKEKTLREWKKIGKYLKSKDLHYESAMAGMFVIAFPVEVTRKQILEVTESSPIILSPCSDRFFL